MHLTLAFEQALGFDAKPVTAEIIEQILSCATDDLNARPSDVRAVLAGSLDPERSRELTNKLRQGGVPF